MHIESHYNHLVSTKTVIPSFDWVEYPKLFLPLDNPNSIVYDYASWILPLSELLGKGNLTVRVYDKKGFQGGSIFSDFLDSIGLGMTEEFVVPSREIGVSLDGRFTDIRQLQWAVLSDSFPVERAAGLAVFRELNAAVGLTGNKTLFSDEDRARLVEACRDSNMRIAKELLKSGASLFRADDLRQSREKDSFTREELLLLPVLMNKIWFDAILNLDLPILNNIKMLAFQKGHHNKDAVASRKYHFHKLIYSIGKRLFPKWFSSNRIRFTPVVLKQHGQSE